MGIRQRENPRCMHMFKYKCLSDSVIKKKRKEQQQTNNKNNRCLFVCLFFLR